MSRKAHGQIRCGQVISTWGPGALLDLPRHAAILGGLDTWPKLSELEEIFEPRLTRKLQTMTGVAAPSLYAPPPDVNDPRETKQGIGAWRFPEWFVVQEQSGSDRSRRLVHRKALDDKSRFEGRPVVPTRFVQACPRGHVDDLDWRRYVHGLADNCHVARAEVHSDELEKGLSIGVYNSRGVFSRSIGEGGVLERSLAERYEGLATAIADSAHRTARMLRGIAESYRSEAAHEDRSASLEEDLGE